MIGNSHVLNMRDKYHKIKKLFEVDYKIFFSKWRRWNTGLSSLSIRDPKTKVFRDWSWRLLRM